MVKCLDNYSVTHIIQIIIRKYILSSFIKKFEKNTDMPVGDFSFQIFNIDLGGG
jgi:hypothetical protein